MEQTAGTPNRPGWYWDPEHLQYNLALRQRWRRDVFPSGPATYRLRRWDGRAWTEETLDDYQLVGMAGAPERLPQHMGPTTRIHPLSRRDGQRNLRIWAACMALAAVAFVVVQVLT
jgi:hypothetical protein